MRQLTEASLLPGKSLAKPVPASGSRQDNEPLNDTGIRLFLPCVSVLCRELSRFIFRPL